MELANRRPKPKAKPKNHLKPQRRSLRHLPGRRRLRAPHQRQAEKGRRQSKKNTSTKPPGHLHWSAESRKNTESIFPRSPEIFFLKNPAPPSTSFFPLPSPLPT